MNHCRSLALLLTCVSSLALATDACSATMNKCRQRDGRIEYTDQPCARDTNSLSDENKTTRRPIGQRYQQIQPEANDAITSRVLSAEDRLKSCDASISIAAAQELVGNPANLKEPLQLFSPAFTFFQNGKRDEGVFWFYAAELRTRQQMIVENGDRGQLLLVMQMTMGGPINNYAFQDTTNLDHILDRVLEWDKKTPNVFVDRARAKKLGSEIDQVYVGFNELKSKLVSEKVALEADARRAAPEIQQMLAQMNSQRCRQGQPDPMYDNHSRKIEEQLALNYVSTNEQVIELAGGAVKASLSLSTTYNNDRNRGRYDFSIMGPRSFYAIVDVNRSSGKPAFNLACITTLSLGYREAGKDACTQSTILVPK